MIQAKYLELRPAYIKDLIVAINDYVVYTVMINLINSHLVRNIVNILKLEYIEEGKIPLSFCDLINGLVKSISFGEISLNPICLTRKNKKEYSQ